MAHEEAISSQHSAFSEKQRQNQNQQQNQEQNQKRLTTEMA